MGGIHPTIEPLYQACRILLSVPLYLNFGTTGGGQEPSGGLAYLDHQRLHYRMSAYGKYGYW
jgi:hypothetical protein